MWVCPGTDSGHNERIMSEPYEEIINGETVLRLPPRPRHEQILHRLHHRVTPVVAQLATTRLLPPRTRIDIGPSQQHSLRPDLALVTAASDRLWLVVEIISSDDHHADTVEKKAVYEEMKLPRLWMIDPRYDNVEVYHGTPYGISLKRILATRDLLTEPLLPGFQIGVHELFAGSASADSGQFDF
jgi:Uma2 family endonuclease